MRHQPCLWRWSGMAALAAGLIGMWWLLSPPHARVATQARRAFETAGKSPVNLRGYNALVLVHEPWVQDDLKLSGDQRRAVDQLVNRFLEGVKAALEKRRNLKDLSPDERAALWPELDRQRCDATRTCELLALELLNEDQQRRLGQIALQLRQEEAFYEEDVARVLAVTPGQIQQIVAGRLALRKEAQSFAEQHSREELSRAQLKSSIRRIRAAALLKYETLLSGPQREAYQQLRGRTIAFSHDDLRWELRPQSASMSMSLH